MSRKRSLFIYYCFNTIVTAASCIGPFSIVGSTKLGNAFPYRVYIVECIPKQMAIVFMCVAVGWFALAIVNHDCLFVTLVNNTRAQLEILKLSLRSVDAKAYNSNQLKQVVDCVRHHIFILRLRKRIEEIFSGVLLLQFFTSFAIFALTGFLAMVGVASKGSQATIYTYCCCISFELFMYCEIVSQVITEVIISPHFLAKGGPKRANNLSFSF